MDRKDYLNNQIEQNKENRHKQFEEKQSKKYGQGEWLQQAYNREIDRLQPIVDAINKMYFETKNMLKEDKDSDAIKIENNFKDLLKLVDSYDVIRKIEN